MMGERPPYNLKQYLAFKYLADPDIWYLLYGGAAGGGKTWLGCEWLMRCCEAFPGTRWFVGRNNLKDCRESVLVTFGKVARHYGYIHYRITDSGIRFADGSEIILLDLTYYPKKDPLYERFGSLEFTGGWIEEAGEVNFKAFDVLKSRIGRHLNDEFKLEPKMLITCNPKKNWLYKTFYKPHKENKLQQPYAFISADVYDNPFITENYIKSLESIEEKSTRMRLLCGMWEYESNANSLVDYDAIIDCFTNTGVAMGEDWLTADLAMKGRDKFVALAWSGLRAKIELSQPFSDGKSIETDLRNVAERRKIRRSHIISDSDGLGQYLESYMKGITEFHGGARAFDSRYYNLKSECTYKLAQYINKGMIYIDCPVELYDTIVEDLDASLCAFDVDNDLSKKRALDKDTVKQILGRSPDYFDPLMMRMLPEIKPMPRGAKVRVGTLS